MVTGGRKFLFIEGTLDTTNGDLRQGFNKLLAQELETQMPRIIMGGNTKATLKKYRNPNLNCKNFALIDLDCMESEKPTVLISHELNESDQVYFMIQEMETWFLSQPSILDAFYGEQISHKIPKKDVKLINSPDEFLQNLTKATRKGKYHKVNHGVALLNLLNAKTLINDFNDFSGLIENLKRA